MSFEVSMGCHMKQLGYKKATTWKWKMKLIQDTCLWWSPHDQYFWKRLTPSLFWPAGNPRHLNARTRHLSHAWSLWDCTWHCVPWQHRPSQLRTGSPLCPNTQWVPPWLPGIHCQEAQTLHTQELPVPFCCSFLAPRSQTWGSLAIAKNLTSPCCRPSERLHSHKNGLHVPCDRPFHKPSSALQKESQVKGKCKTLFLKHAETLIVKKLKPVLNVSNMFGTSPFCDKSSLQQTGSMSTWPAMRHSPTNQASQRGYQRCQCQSWSRTPAPGQSSWCHPGAGRVIRDQRGRESWLVNTTRNDFLARRCLLKLLHSCQPGFCSKLSRLLSFSHVDPEMRHSWQLAVQMEKIVWAGQ